MNILVFFAIQDFFLKITYHILLMKLGHNVMHIIIFIACVLLYNGSYSIFINPRYLKSDQCSALSALLSAHIYAFWYLEFKIVYINQLLHIHV